MLLRTFLDELWTIRNIEAFLLACVRKGKCFLQLINFDSAKKQAEDSSFLGNEDQWSNGTVSS